MADAGIKCDFVYKIFGVNETITVSGEVLSFFNTGIDTRVYFIKNF